MKRKQTESTSDFDDNKKGKTSLEVGDIVASLKQRLKEEQHELAALQEFVKEAKSDSTGKEFVEIYLKTSPECKELFSLFDIDGRVPAEKLAVIWEGFESILSIVSNETKDSFYHSVGSFISSKILQNHLKQIYWSLGGNSGNHLSRNALTCVTLMLAQGLQTVKEFVSVFDFSLKGLKVISQKRDRKQKPDTRTCFVRFCLAFFVFGDTAVIKKILEEKGLPALILNDLNLDSPDAILATLETLYEQVVRNSGIMKKTKLLFFNPTILFKLTTLLKRHEESIQRITSNILETLCTSAKYGICFVQSEEGNNDKLLNPVLLKFLLSIKQHALQNENLFQLTLKTLNTCTDLVVPYFNGLNLQMEPRHSETWYTNIHFIMKFLKNLPVKINGLNNESIILKKTILTNMSRLQFMTGLKNKTKKVKQLTMSLLEMILLRCLQVKEVYNFSDDFNDKIIQVLPDVSAIITIRQNFSKTSISETHSHIDGNKKHMEDPAIEPDIDEKELLVSSLNCLHLFQKFHPGILTESGFNICKLITISDDCEEVVVIKSLEIMLLEKTGVRGWIEKKIPGSDNVIHCILSLISKFKRNTDIVLKLEELFMKIMNLSDQCVDFHDELKQWLTAFIDCLDDHHNKTDCQQFSDCCMKMLNEPLVYVEEILSLTDKYCDQLNRRKISGLPFSPLTVVMAKSFKLQDSPRLMIPVLKALLVYQQHPEILFNILSEKNDFETHDMSKQPEFHSFVVFTLRWAQAINCKEIQSKINRNLILLAEKETEPDEYLDRLVFWLSNLANAQRAHDSKSVKKHFTSIAHLISELDIDKEKNLEGIASLICNVLQISYESGIERFPKIFSNLQTHVIKLMNNLLTGVKSSATKQSILDRFFCLTLRSERNEKWDGFVQKCYIAVVKCFPLFQKSQKYTAYMEESIEKCFEENKTEKLAFFRETFECVADSTRDLIVHKLVMHSLGVFDFKNHNETLEMVTNVISNEKHSIKLTVDIKLLQDFCNMSLATRNQSAVGFLLRILNLSQSHVKLEVKKNEFISLLTENEGQCFNELLVCLCQRNDILLKLFMERCLRSNLLHGNVDARFLPLIHLALERIHLGTIKDEQFCYFTVENCWDDILSFLKSNPSRFIVSLTKYLLPFTPDERKFKAVNKFNEFSEPCFNDVIQHMILSLTDEKLKIRSAAAVCSTHLGLLLRDVNVTQEEFNFVKQLINILRTTDKHLKLKYFEGIAEKWNSIVKHVLKHGITNAMTLDILSMSVELLYSVKKFNIKVYTLKDIHQMILSHSKFTEILLTENVAEKAGVLKLLATLTKIDSSVCNKSFIPLLLSAYQATQSECDQLILSILQTYERSDITLSDYYPLVWGEGAYDVYKQRQQQKNRLTELTSSQILANINNKLMTKSAIEYPTEKALLINIKEVKVLNEHYDPSFFLSMFSSILQIEMQFDCRHFIESGCLSFLISSLSSYDKYIRKLAYYNLSLFNDQVENSKFKEKKQVVYFLMLLKNSVNEEFMRLPTIWCVFFTRYFQSMLHSDQHIYPILSNIIVQKPIINVRELPVFLTLLNSSSLERVQEQKWLLKLLADGIKDQKDYYLYKKYHVFEMLMALYDSKIVAKSAQPIILETLLKTSSITAAAYDLVKTNCILSWIHSCIFRSSDLNIFIQILHGLVNAFDIKEENPVVPKLLANEMAFIFQIQIRSLSHPNQIRMCSVFSKITSIPNVFGELLLWIHTDQIAEIFCLISELLVMEEYFDQTRNVFVNLFNAISKQRSCSNEIFQITQWKQIRQLAEKKNDDELLSIAALGAHFG